MDKQTRVLTIDEKFGNHTYESVTTKQLSKKDVKDALDRADIRIDRESKKMSKEYYLGAEAFKDIIANILLFDLNL